MPTDDLIYVYPSGGTTIPYNSSTDFYITFYFQPRSGNKIWAKVVNSSGDELGDKSVYETAGSTASFSVNPSNIAGTIPIGSKMVLYTTITDTSGSGFYEIDETYPINVPVGYCTAPGTVTLEKTSAAPGESVELSWSAGGGGTSNSIKEYHVYRATSASGTYTKIHDTNSASTRKCDVTAPTTNVSSYYYKVVTAGSASGYDSSKSTAYATLTCSYSAPGTPTGVSISPVYAKSGNVTLSWTAPSDTGTNNGIKHYQVYQDGAAYQTTTELSMDVPCNAAAGGSYTYTVKAIGNISGSDGGISSGTTVYTYSDPAPPTSYTLSETSPMPGVGVTLSWNGAEDGVLNAIQSYNVYGATSADGAYELLSNVTGTSCVVTSHSEYGGSFYYKVAAVGERSTGAKSETYATLTTISVTNVGAPPSCSVSSTLSVIAVDLTWEAAEDGIGNAVAEYDIERRASEDGQVWGNWVDLDTVDAAVTSLSVDPPQTAGHYYQFRVRAVGTAGALFMSDWTESANTLRRGHDPLEGFTDPVLVAGETEARAIHMLELQDRVSTLLAFYGKAAREFMPVIALNPETGIKHWTEHIGEVRAAVDEISTDHDAWIEIPENHPRVDVMYQLRDIILSL